MIDDEPFVVIHDDLLLPFQLIDLSALPAAQRDAEVERLLIDEPRRPYHLDREPGIRVTLLRLGPTHHIIMMMMHHLFTDWASTGNIWRELSALYREGRRGERMTLLKPAAERRDHAERRARKEVRDHVEQDLRYWRERLREAPSVLELPADRPRPPVLTYRGARRRFTIPSGLTQALRERSRAEKVSLFSMFAAVLNALLYRYTSQDDISIGIPLADRDDLDAQSEIGFLLHTHVLRTRLSGDMSVRQLLVQTQKDILDLYVHRSPSFDEVVSAVQPARSPSYSPLFQVMLNWRGGENLFSNIGLDGLEIESVLAESRTAKFDLTLMLTDAGERIDLEIEYSTDLFDGARIERLVGHFSSLLGAAATDPNQLLLELPLLTEAESRQLADWNRTEIPYPKERCLHRLFEEQVERAPDAIAVTFEAERLTYRQLDERANQLAHRLQKLGVGPDALVAICLERSLEMVVALLGVLKAGGAYVPLDPAYPPERLAYVLRDSEAVVLLTQDSLRERFQSALLKPLILCLDSAQEPIAREGKQAPTSGASSENLAYVIYTSGSTGEPKGVEILRRNVVNLLYAMARELSFAPNDKLLAVTTISFDIAGLELFLPLISGGQVEVTPAAELRDGFALRRRVERSGATVIQATPATWSMTIEGGWAGDRRLKALCGGEAVTPALAEALMGRCGDVWNVYGPTETTIWSSFDRMRTGRPITIGRPIANTRFYVVDKHGEPLPVGVPGELLIGGEGLARGYFRRPELTAEKFVASRLGPAPSNRLYKTGDLVRRLADGTVEWLGRLDHQVKIRGFRIELGEIEAALISHPSVREAVVVAREDTPGDKRLIAYLTASDRETPQDSELRGLLRAKLPEYMAPSAFVHLGRFPLTPNGKVDRKALPRPDANPPKPDEMAVSPTEAQRRLSDIWLEALGLDRVGPHDNFFELGGHSLLAVRVIAQINRSLGAHLNVTQLFQHPTVYELAGLLEAARVAPKPRVLPLHPGRSEPRLYFIGASPTERRIAKSIGADLAIFGTDAPLPMTWRRALANSDEAGLPTIEQLGLLHGEAVRDHAGGRPCLLAGYSFHGKVVIEAARAFQRAGGEVVKILLIDSTAWTGPMQGMRETLGHVWRGEAGSPGNDHYATLLGRSLNSLSWLVAQAPPFLERGLARISSDASVEEGYGWMDEEGGTVPLSEMKQLFLRGPSSFSPRPIDAAAVLFRARRPGDRMLPRAGLDNGWSGLFTRGLEIVETEGNHFSLVRDERIVAELGRQISGALDRIADVPEFVSQSLDWKLVEGEVRARP